MPSSPSSRAMIKKDLNERDFECWLILGKKAQGKSTLMRDLVDKFLKKYGKAWAKYKVIPKVFAHALSDSKSFSKIYDIGEIAEVKGLESALEVLAGCDKYGTNKYWKMTNALKSICREDKEIEALHRALSKLFRYGFILFDEWTVYAKSNPSGWATDIAFNHRNYRQEVLFACHKLMSVPHKMASGDVFTKIILFKTGEWQPRNNVFMRFSCAPLIERAFYVVRDAPKIPFLVQYHCIIDTNKDKIMEWNYKAKKPHYSELGATPIYKQSKKSKK